MGNFLSVFFLLFALTGALYFQTKRITVAKDGSGDYLTVQQAIDAVADSNRSKTIIYIKNGVYKEKLRLAAAKMNVHFIGENVEKTVLTYDDYARKKDSKGRGTWVHHHPQVFSSLVLILLPKTSPSKIPPVLRARQWR